MENLTQTTGKIDSSILELLKTLSISEIEQLSKQANEIKKEKKQELNNLTEEEKTTITKLFDKIDFKSINKNFSVLIRKNEDNFSIQISNKTRGKNSNSDVSRAKFVSYTFEGKITKENIFLESLKPEHEGDNKLRYYGLTIKPDPNKTLNLRTNQLSQTSGANQLSKLLYLYDNNIFDDKNDIIVTYEKNGVNFDVSMFKRLNELKAKFNLQLL
jgi:hypothetical protein